MKYLGLLGRQATAGLIVGLSAVIYAISYGALLFSGPLADYVGFGITIALITAVIGGLFGALSEERTFFSGPDSNTVSVLASVLAVMSAAMPAPQSLTLAVATVVPITKGRLLSCSNGVFAMMRKNSAGSDT